eukprot:Skav204045  [mRNA]  locus=scaffold3:178294:179307:- [translate_table: standard]
MRLCSFRFVIFNRPVFTRQNCSSLAQRTPCNSALASPASIGMEVVCLNGQAIIVKPAESLHEAKIKVAQALRAFPEAVKISCEGELLSGSSESLADLLKSQGFEAVKSPLLFTVVDQERTELEKHLAFFRKDLVAYQKGLVRCQNLNSEWTQRRKVLRDHFEGVQRIRKEEQLKDLGSKLAQAVIRWEDVRSNLEEKIWHARIALGKMLKGSEECHKILLEFDDKTWLPDPNCFGICTCCSCQGWLDEPSPWESQDLCPRLLRREWWNSKKDKKGSWKKEKMGQKIEQQELEPYTEERSLDPLRDRPKPKSPKSQKRRESCSDIKNQLSQLRELSLE